MAGKKVPVFIEFSALDKVSGPIKNLARRFEATFAPINRFQNSLARLSRASGLTAIAKGFENTFSWITKATAAIGIMGFAAKFAFDKLVGNSIEATAKLGEVAQRTGVSAEELQKWQFAAEQTGGSADAMNEAFVKFEKTLSMTRRNKGELAEALGGLNNSQWLQQLVKIKDVSKAMDFFMDGLSKIDDTASQTELALHGMGRGAEDLLGLAKAGSKARQELFLQKIAIGLVSDAQVQQFREFQDHEKRVGNRFEVVRTRMISHFLPTFDRLFDVFDKFLQNHGPELDRLAVKIGDSLEKLVIKFQDLKAEDVEKFWSGLIEKAERLAKAVDMVARGVEKLNNYTIFPIETKYERKPGLIESFARNTLGIGGGPAVMPEPSPRTDTAGATASVKVVFENVPPGVSVDQGKVTGPIDFETFVGRRMGMN